MPLLLQRHWHRCGELFIVGLLQNEAAAGIWLFSRSTMDRLSLCNLIDSSRRIPIDRFSIFALGMERVRFKNGQVSDNLESKLVEVNTKYNLKSDHLPRFFFASLSWQ